MTKLGDIIDTTSGKAIRNVSNFGKYPVYGSNGIIGYSDDYQNERAVIIGRVGAYCGSIYLCDAKFWPSDNTIIAKPKTDNNLYFINYLLKNLKLNNLAGGSAQPLLTQGVIKSFEIDKIFSENVQQKIASILSAYDDLIENNNKRIKVLEETGKNLFEFLYKVVDKTERYTFNKTDDLVLPKGWSYKLLRDFSEITFGFPFKSKLFTEEVTSFPVIRIRDILNGFTKTYTSENTGDIYIVSEGDILIGMDGDFHMCKWANSNAYLNQRVMRLRTKTKEYPTYLLFLQLLKPISYLNTAVVGTTVAHLTGKDIDRLRILIPPKDVIDKFRNSFNAIYKEELLLRHRNWVLSKIKNLLLPKLISGELDVEGLDIKIRPEIL